MVYFWLSLIPFIRLPRLMAYVHLAMMFVGACPMKSPTPALALDMAETPRRHDKPIDAFSFWNHVVSGGYALVIASFVLLVLTVIAGLKGDRVRNQS